MSKRIPTSILVLGIVSLFMDISSEIIHGLLPVFLVVELGASYTAVGALEGIAEAVVLLTKVISGPLSDRLGRRKPLVVAGYALAAASKPLFAIAGGVGAVLGARFLDRMGKGIRGAPRDALIADVTPPKLRGRAYGLRQSLDTAGAVIGPVLAILLMRLTANDYRSVFWFAGIPALISVLILIRGIQEQPADRKEKEKLSLRALKRFSGPFWIVSVIGGFFQLALFSEAFLILRAKELGLAPALAPAVLITMNVAYALTAYPAGKISDEKGRLPMLLVGCILLVAADACLAVASSLWWALAGTILWGVHLGFTHGVLAALVADFAPSDRKGTAYGLFNLVSALALLVASVGAGVLWDHVGAKGTFTVGAVIGLLTAIFLLLIASRAKKHLC